MVGGIFLSLKDTTKQQQYKRESSAPYQEWKFLGDCEFLKEIPERKDFAPGPQENVVQEKMEQQKQRVRQKKYHFLGLKYNT